MSCGFPCWGSEFFIILERGRVIMQLSKAAKHKKKKQKSGAVLVLKAAEGVKHSSLRSWLMFTVYLPGHPFCVTIRSTPFHGFLGVCWVLHNEEERWEGNQDPEFSGRDGALYV